jgi:Ca-activated chloride channel family protein
MKATKKINPGAWGILLPGILISMIVVGIAFAMVLPPAEKMVPVPGGNGKGAIRGRVADAATNQPVPSAKITVFIETLPVKEILSDAQGNYSVPDLDPGAYRVRAVMAGYQDFNKKVTVEKDKATILDIRMKATVADSILVKKNNNQIPSPEKTRGKDSKVQSECIAITTGAGGYPVQYDVYNQPFNTESYDKINENAFKDVISNPLSTFSIDVDKASYSNVRRFLNDNMLPYKDAVRIEEMINYFDYDYPQPSNGDPFSVRFETGDCPWKSGHKLVLIGIKGKEIPVQDIPSGNFVFLIDVSGSMEAPNKLPLLKQAFRILVNNLRPEDKVAMVVYAGAAGCVLESTPGSHKERILAALDMLEAGGSTAGGAGLELAYRIAKENYIQSGNNRVILATDGDFNIGPSSDGEMTRLIEEKRKTGIFLSVLGFGMGNYKDSKMEKIADAGDGNYAYIDNVLEARKVFGEELWGTLFTIAKDVKIQVEFNPATVKAYRLIGYENRILNKEDFNDDKKDAGDIGCGHTVTALYEIVLAGSSEQFPSVDPLEYQTNQVHGGSGLMTVKLRYKNPGDTVSRLIVNRIREADLKNDTPGENFRFASAVAEFGMLLRDSEFKGTSDFDHVIAMASASKGKDPYGYRQEFVRLVRIASALSGK